MNPQSKKEEKITRRKTGFIIIGSGIAGLYTALKLAQYDNVIVLCKKSAIVSNTWFAQGGIAAAFHESDSPEQHFLDTVGSGANFGDQDAIRLMVEEGPSCIRDLQELGVEFDRSGDKLALGREGAHSCRRILRIGGDATGRFLVQSLHGLVEQNERISIIEDAFALDIIVGQGRCLGVRWKGPDGIFEHFSKAVVLATGGGGYLYSYTTNPSTATADGLALAYHAGASLRDMEFVQFHPTVFFKDNKAFLISEAVRGEGAILLNERGERFMSRYHKLGELGPRDVLARAIVQEKEATGGEIYLDLRHLGSDYVKNRFPTIYQTCLEWGLNITDEPVPICPAAHYFIGGIKVNDEGETEVKSLYAVGEAASTGVHGANRLASNSLLEAVVFGCRTALSIASVNSVSEVTEPEVMILTNDEQKCNRDKIPLLREEFRKLMWDRTGLFRTEGMLEDALDTFSRSLAEWSFDTLDPEIKEMQNMILVGCFIASAALDRRESLGCHYRLDYPEKSPEAKYHLLFRRETGLKGVKETCTSPHGSKM